MHRTRGYVLAGLLFVALCGGSLGVVSEGHGANFGSNGYWIAAAVVFGAGAIFCFIRWWLAMAESDLPETIQSEAD